MVSNSNSLHLSGVGDPFLSQDIRFHCPVFGIINFSKPKAKSFERHVWLYNQGDNDLLREKASTTDWESFKSPNIDLYAEGITNRIPPPHPTAPPPPIYIGNTEINDVSAHKHLGIFFSNDCSWRSHIDYIKEKARKRINIMRKLKFVLDWKALETISVSFIRQ